MYAAVKSFRQNCFKFSVLFFIRLYYVTPVSRRAAGIVMFGSNNSNEAKQVEQAGEKKEISTQCQMNCFIGG